MSRGWAAAVVLVVAAAARLVVALTAEPALSNDIWRYIFDGQNLAAGVNPYTVRPEAELDRLRAAGDASDAAWIERINNRHLATIYQPVSQWVFAATVRASAWVHGEGRTPGGDARVLRVVLGVLDVGVVAVLVGALWAAGRSVWWAALYAWHPLVIAEVAWSGHQDVIGILPLAGAVVCAQGRPRTIARGVGSGVLLALAIAVKPVVAPVGLLMAWRWRDAKPQAAAAAAACVAALVVLYLPFALMPGGLEGMWVTGKTFVNQWAYNGSVHAVIESGFGNKRAADVVCGVVLLGVLAWAIVARLDVIEAAVVYLFFALLLSSTCHPWYLLWVLALVPLRPGGWMTPAVLVWSATIGLSYTAFWTAEFKPLGWSLWLEYVPVYAALGVGAVGMLRAMRRSA